MRSLRVLPLFLLLTTPALAQEKKPEPAPPAASVALELPATTTLGSMTTVKVTVTHEADGKAFPATHNWFGVSLRITLGGREFLYAKFNPEVLGQGPRPSAPPADVKQGAQQTVEIPILFPKAAAYTIVAEYRGRDLSGRAAPISSAGKTIKVAPKGDVKELTVRVETTEGGFTLAFWPHEALCTGLNFIHLAHQGYYAKTGFHRIITGFMSQGGDPKGNGSGGPGYSIPHEFNARRHEPGVISMARSRSNDSAGSQFFLCAKQAEFLDRNYTAFGYTKAGLDVVLKINAIGSKGPNGVPPNKEVKVKSATVMVGGEAVVKKGS